MLSEDGCALPSTIAQMSRQKTLMGLLARTARSKPSLKQTGCLRAVYASAAKSSGYLRKAVRVDFFGRASLGAPLFEQLGIATKKGAAGPWGRVGCIL
jgi:hypothetical protein